MIPQTLKRFLHILLSMAIGGTWCVGQSMVGTSAAQFLKIEVGGRAVAMGGAYVALANDVSSLYWNPAGIATMDRIQLMGSHTQWFADIDHNFIGIAYPVAIDHVVGLSVTMLSSGEMEQTTVQQPDGNGVFFEATDLAVGLTYGMHLTDKLSVGLTGKYIRQTAFNESAQTFAADIGILLDTDFHGLRIGMDFSNLGGELQLDGTDLITNATVRKGTSAVARLATESYQLPLNFRVGVAMKVIGNSPGAVVSSSDNALTVTIDGNHPNDNRETLSCGTEYVWNDLLAVRGGYIMNHDVAKFSFGGGIHWTMMENFGLNLDYAYADLGILNSVQRISLSLQF